MSKSILIVDDERDIRSSLTGILEDEGYIVASVAGGREALESVRQDLPDLVLLDIWMPGMDGLEVLGALKSIFPQLTIIMISGHGTIETAVKATRLGAYDFIEKPLSLDKVLISVANALKMSDLQEENETLRQVLTHESTLVGASPLMSGLRLQVERIARSAAPVLLSGENGTGKKLVAHIIHQQSSRADKPFIGINCSALPAELLEAELCGYIPQGGDEGSSLKKGKIDAADGGTLYIDEICDMPLELQAKLVRYINESCFQRVGGERRIRADVRIVAASCRDLMQEVREGRFREDLYYLISVVQLQLPALRDHTEDIPELVAYFARQFSLREGWDTKEFTPQSLDYLKSIVWTGNVRELRNAIERILIMFPGAVVTAEDISWLGGRMDEAGVTSGNGSLRDAREEFEKAFILQKLEENDWNISKTAEVIELERSNLHRKIKSYGIEVRR